MGRVGGPVDEAALEKLRSQQRRLVLKAARLVDVFGVEADFSPEDLVQHAVTTLIEDGCPEGEDPIAVAVMHMKQKASNCRRHHSKFPKTDLENAPAGGPSGSHPRDGARARDGASLADAVFQRVYDQAESKGDTEVQELVLAFAEMASNGETEHVRGQRKVLMEATGFSENTYGNAIRRLGTFVGRLPADLRDEVSMYFGGGT